MPITMIPSSRNANLDALIRYTNYLQQKRVDEERQKEAEEAADQGGGPLGAAIGGGAGAIAGGIAAAVMSGGASIPLSMMASGAVNSAIGGTIGAVVDPPGENYDQGAQIAGYINQGTRGVTQAMYAGEQQSYARGRHRAADARADRALDLREDNSEFARERQKTADFQETYGMAPEEYGALEVIRAYGEGQINAPAAVPGRPSADPTAQARSRGFGAGQPSGGVSMEGAGFGNEVESPYPQLDIPQSAPMEVQQAYAIENARRAPLDQAWNAKMTQQSLNQAMKDGSVVFDPRANKVVFDPRRYEEVDTDKGAQQRSSTLNAINSLQNDPSFSMTDPRTGAKTLKPDGVRAARVLAQDLSGIKKQLLPKKQPPPAFKVERQGNSVRHFSTDKNGKQQLESTHLAEWQKGFAEAFPGQTPADLESKGYFAHYDPGGNGGKGKWEMKKIEDGGALSQKAKDSFQKSWQEYQLLNQGKADAEGNTTMKKGALDLEGYAKEYSRANRLLADAMRQVENDNAESSAITAGSIDGKFAQAGSKDPAKLMETEKGQRAVELAFPQAVEEMFGIMQQFPGLKIPEGNKQMIERVIFLTKTIQAMPGGEAKAQKMIDQLKLSQQANQRQRPPYQGKQ